MKTGKETWHLKPNNEHAESIIVDRLYDFGKRIYHGQSPSWNGNNIPICVGENFTFSKGKIKLSIDAMYEDILNDKKYWDYFVVNSEMGVPVLKTFIDGIGLDFWIVYPKENSNKYLDLRITYNSAIEISKKYEKFYEKELKQHYEIPIDQTLLNKLSNHESAKKNPIKMWKQGLDAFVLLYYNESKQSNFNGELHASFDIKEGHMIGHTICRSLKEQLIQTSLRRSGHQGHDIRNYDNDTHKDVISNRLKDTEKKEILETYKWIKVKKYVDDDNLSWKERYKKLEQHHIEETSFLINKIREIIKK